MAIYVRWFLGIEWHLVFLQLNIPLTIKKERKGIQGYVLKFLRGNIHRQVISFI